MNPPLTMTDVPGKAASASPPPSSVKRRASRHQRDSAFTLIEMLAAMALLGLISSLLFFSLDQVTRATTQGLGKSTMYQDARTVIDQMSRELQQAIPYVAIIPPPPAIGGATNNIFIAETLPPPSPSQIHFVATIDNNTGYEEAEVHYYYDGSNTLYKALTLYGTNIWDFQDNPILGGTGPGSWDQTPLPPPPIPGPTDPYAPVLDGVQSLSFNFWTNSPLSGDIPVNLWLAKKNSIPAYVEVTLVVYDANVIRRWGSADKATTAGMIYLARTNSFFVQLPRQDD